MNASENIDQYGCTLALWKLKLKDTEWKGAILWRKNKNNNNVDKTASK